MPRPRLKSFVVKKSFRKVLPFSKEHQKSAALKPLFSLYFILRSLETAKHEAVHLIFVFNSILLCQSKYARGGEE